MTAEDQSTLEWRDGVPVARRFDDPYFSLGSGLEETRHVFLSGNALPSRFRDGFHVAELGFGTGLNLVTTWQAWREAGAPGRLTFTSFEAFPLDIAQMARALSAFPQVAELAERLCAAGTERGGLLSLGDGVSLNLILGDARETLPAWSGKADAWFLDGFAPAKNPELWSDAMMAQVAAHTAPGGSFATYTAAGHVRRALAYSGFAVDRVEGYGLKRHMTVGTLETPE